MEDKSPTRRKSGTLWQSTGNQQVLGSSYRQSAGEESDKSHESSTTDDLEMDEMRSDDELEDDEETGLTEPQRKKRSRRRNRYTRLDERVSEAASINTNASVSSTEQKLLTPTIVRNMTVNSLLIGLWYSFSISISVYNKWMFSADNLDFHFPLFTTSLHMLVQFSLASSVLFFMPRFRPGNDGSNPHEPSYSRLNNSEDESANIESTQPPKPLMTSWFYFTRIGPCGTATALDIGLGNFSLRYISLTFFTMCKSSVLGFVLVFAFIFHLEQPTWRLCFIILVMTAGVIMMVAGETAFEARGFILVMTASLCSGFRWSLTQILLLRNRATSNPFSSIFFLTPVMFLALFLLALPIEGPTKVIIGIKELSKSEGGFVSFLLLLFPGILAFLMVSAEFALLKRTSVVTLSVCGIFKEVLTISAAGAIFGDELSPINISGLLVTIASIAAYNYLKYTKMKKEAAKEVHEILVEEQLEPGEDRDKGAMVVGSDQAGERRDSSSALIADNLHLNTEINPEGVGIDRQTNGVISSPSKRPEHIE